MPHPTPLTLTRASHGCSGRASVRAALALAIVACALLPALQARALPRYAARYEQNCMLCHVNPTGAGMRSAYAVQELIPKEFAMSPATPEMLKDIDPKIGKHLSIGTDFRELFLLESQGSALAPPQGFFPMQGDLYVMFQLDPKFLLYYDRGMSNTYEAFGLAHILPWDGYVKAGRFVPPYGWKFDDHTMFVRDSEGFAPPANSDGGVEVGLSPNPFEVQVALVNGARGATLDNDRRLAASGNASARFRVGPVAASLGLAGYVQPGITEDLSTGGVFGYLSGWNITWVAQNDWVRRHPMNAGPNTGIVSSQELTVLMKRGIELKSTYDFYDPDRHVKSGSKDRWGVGFDLMPRSFLVVEALYRHTRVQSGAALPVSGYDEGLLQLHLLY
jgi:hypothetical protein